MSGAAFVVIASTAFILYVLIGYPLFLAFYARLYPRPIRKEFHPQPLSVVIPVRNGGRWIEAKLRSVLSSNYPADLIEILVVSDGSTDGTNAMVQSFPDSRVRLLALPPGGKAVAVTQGMEATSTGLIVLTDVRQEFDPEALSLLVACFADPAVGVVTGELVIRQGLRQEEANTGLYWKYEKWIRRNLNRVNAMLGATGSIYAIRREVATVIPPGTLLDDVFVPFIGVSRGYRIYFEDQAKAYDLPTSLQSEFWRKVRTQAGIYQITASFPALLWPGNSRFVHWTSHKLGRLMLPFAMIATAVASFGLPDPLRIEAILGQAAFYCLGLVDPLIPERSPLKRLSGVIRAFVVLVTAALCAVTVFIMPAQRLWRETRVGVPQATAKRDQAPRDSL